jgi:O-antigen/teichoic acid export membrane protein
LQQSVGVTRYFRYREYRRSFLIEQADLLLETSEPVAMAVFDSTATSNHVIQKAARAGKALFLRQVLVYGFNIGGSVILARLLPAAQYGYYGIVLFLIVFLGIFGGTGFAGNLIRMNEEPTSRDFEVMFTVQQAMIAVIFAFVWFIAPRLGIAYHLGVSGAWFFRMFGGALVLTSFMVMPQIKMERELAFDRLAMVEVCQAVGFNVSAILFALKGWGALSFSAALLMRSGIGAVLAHLSSPWKFAFRWDLELLKKHLQYGVALQAGQVIGVVVRDSISPLLIGMLLGAADVGYVTWATSLAGYSIWVLVPLQRLYLPLFARLQSDPARLKTVVESVLWMVNAVVAPLALITLALSHPITKVIFGDKWAVALPLYYLICAANTLASNVLPLTGVLNALGQSRKTLQLSILWTTATWVFGAPLVWWFGLKGFGFALIGIQSTNILLYRSVSRLTGVTILKSYFPSWPVSAGIAAALVLLQVVSPVHHITGLVTYGILAMSVYAAILWFGFPDKSRRILRLREVRPRFASRSISDQWGRCETEKQSRRSSRLNANSREER